MYVDPYYNKKVTLRNILDTYQEYMFTRHKIDIKLKLDETIPNELKVTEDMKFSEYYKLKFKIKRWKYRECIHKWNNSYNRK